MRDRGGNDQPSLLLVAYALCLQGDPDAAQAELDDSLDLSRLKPTQRTELTFLVQQFHLTIQHSISQTNQRSNDGHSQWKVRIEEWKLARGGHPDRGDAGRIVCRMSNGES